ncbi:hypothetical protein EWM64_g437 [Hericium alpestre]|uniref:Uncharacterized protein n=1 Tax=Hericium alpestre TaxID=135208 RepID=A0A4Z0ACT6_9AGAM|nr:hypothetical protein EWM64_g437 [Hericium alpestre]
MTRVRRLEGLGGLFKGLMPTLIWNITLMAFSVLFLDASLANPRNHGIYNAPATGFLGTLFYSIFLMLVSLPAVIITYRSITTPHHLPYFNPTYSLRVLLTPTERRKPWILYFTPGLLAAETLHITYVVLEVSTVQLLIYFIVVLISTAILCPLEVISTRLSVQRNHVSPEFNSTSQEEEGDSEATVEYSGAEEDVIGFVLFVPVTAFSIYSL